MRYRFSLNEHEDAKQYLYERSLAKDAFDKLRIVARYYIDEGYDLDSVKNLLREFVANCGESFMLNSWSDMITSAIKKSKKTKAILIDSITVSKPEIDVIGKIKGVQARRFAFTLLCLKKYFNAINPDNNDWICVDHEQIMQLANIKAPLQKQAELYRILMDQGLIELPNKLNRVAIHVTFDDIDGEEAIQICDFRNLGNRYMMYIGEPYFQCSNCGLVVRMPNGKQKTKPYKYCRECARQIKLKQSINSVMKKYYKDADIEYKIIEPIKDEDDDDASDIVDFTEFGNI